jgi:mycothiol synthase
VRTIDRIASPRPWTSRPYEIEDNLRQMQGLLMEARSRTDDWRYPHVGDLMWWFFMVLCHLGPQEFVRLWHDGQGKLIGYAILGEDPSFDCQVLPEYAWRGIEEEALAWAEGRVAKLRQGDATRWGGRMVTNTRQDDARRIAFLEQHGFRRAEYAEVSMIRALTEHKSAPDGATTSGQNAHAGATTNKENAEPTLPDGYQVRAVEEGEISERAAAQREVWGLWPVGNVSDDDYRRFMRLPGYDRELDVVAVAPDGVIAAYVNGWLDPVNRIGDFGPVGARPAYRRRGLTRSVLHECMRRMQARGMERVSVSTGETSVPARGLYESVGFRVVDRCLDYVKTG